MAELWRSKEGGYTVTANQLTKKNVSEVALWCGGVPVVEHDALNHAETFVGINVPTALGMMRASEGMYIIQSPTGEFYIATPDKFASKFEPEIVRP